VFQSFFDDTADKPAPQSTLEMTNKHSRNEVILALADAGKTDAQIASELGITRNEVQLVIGLTGK
jgi:DNA-binding NarL/FixJ family response regulator